MLQIQVVIVSPALADANNGNWQTARRWQRLLGSVHRTRIVAQWPDALAQDARGCPRDTVMLALHARRSAASVAAWAARRGPEGLGVVLTGTDLYRDIRHDATAQASLDLAQRLVVLNPLGLDELRPAWRDKAGVLLQSVSARQPVAKTGRHLRVLMVGHLRDEKSPETYFEAARRLRSDEGILLDHIGRPLDADLGRQAQAVQAGCPHYRWLGGLGHADTRRRIQHAHVLVHPSRMEGGAHVVMEAVRSGTPVLASDIAGNVGLLGSGYGGLFPWGDAAALVAGLRRLRAVPDALAGLAAQCDARAHLFAPEAERQALLALVASLALTTSHRT